jgi:hypothetical protein
VSGIDAITTTGMSSTTINFTNSHFSVADVGKTIALAAVGPSGTNYVTAITGFNSPTSIAVSVGASVASSGILYKYATDDSTALTNAVNDAVAKGLVLKSPRGSCFFHSQLQIYNPITILGDNKSGDFINREIM